jgi:hypothetical protein
MAGQYKKHQVANFTTTMLSAGIASLPIFFHQNRKATL